MAEIKWITVSVDSKIEEAWRGMARCEAAGRAAGERGNRLDQADWEIYAGQWQARDILISIAQTASIKGE